jgi:hypothetical protein
VPRSSVSLYDVELSNALEGLDHLGSGNIELCLYVNKVLLGSELAVLLSDYQYTAGPARVVCACKRWMDQTTELFSTTTASRPMREE